jgi:hypothetical protein
MSRALTSLACCGALAACVPVSPAADLAPVSNLAGEYRVAGIDGKAADQPFGLALSISSQRIIFDAPCGGYAWAYRLEGQRLSLSQTVRPDPACLAAARIHHAVFDLAAAVDAATQAGRDRSNAVILAGGGHSVTLYSQ